MLDTTGCFVVRGSSGKGSDWRETAILAQDCGHRLDRSSRRWHDGHFDRCHAGIKSDWDYAEQGTSYPQYVSRAAGVGGDLGKDPKCNTSLLTARLRIACGVRWH